MSRRGSILQDYGGHFQPMPLDSQLAAASYYQRDKEMNAQLNERKQQRKDKEAAELIGDIKIGHIGDNTIDVMTDKQLQVLQGKLMDMHMKGASTTDLQLYAQRELPKISNGHTIAKNKYDQIKSGLTELGKDYTTGDFAKARELAVKPMLQDVLEFDENGNAIGYKETSIIPEKNYVTPLLEDNNLSQWYRPSGGLEKHIKDLPTTKIGESKKVRNKKGVEIDNSWEGYGSVFSRLVTDENGATVGQEIKYENVPLGKNQDGTVNNVKVLPQAEFDVLTGTPTAKADFNLKFNKAMVDAGVDPSQIDPRAKGVLKRQFAYDWLNQTKIDGSSFIPKQAEKQPLPPRVSVKINSGKDVEVDINDLYSRIGKKIDDNIDKGFDATRFSSLTNDEQAIVKQAVENAGYELDEGGGNIYLSKDGDNYKVYKAQDGKPLPKEGNNEIATLSFEGTNTKVQPGVKEKREVVEQGKNFRNKKTFDVVDPNTGKVVMSGVDQSAADKAKAKGYKIQ